LLCGWAELEDCRLNKENWRHAIPRECAAYNRHTIAQSFSPFSSQDGRQVRRPDPTRATNLFSKI
jgi:hypothetical protein